MADLIGAPYELHGRSNDGMDCIGVVIEAFRREHSIDLPDPRPGGDADLESFAKLWDEVVPPVERFDMIHFVQRGQDGVALVLDGRFAMSANPNYNVFLMKIEALLRIPGARIYRFRFEDWNS